MQRRMERAIKEVNSDSQVTTIVNYFKLRDVEVAFACKYCAFGITEHVGNYEPVWGSIRV